METTQQKREEILKILQMIEEGKIDEDKALGMIAMLEGKNVVGYPGGMVAGGHGEGRHKCSKWVTILGGGAGFAVLVGLLYVLFVYLPVHATPFAMIVVYSFLGLTVVAGAIVAVFAVTKTMAVGRAAVEKKASAATPGEKFATDKVPAP